MSENVEVKEENVDVAPDEAQVDEGDVSTPEDNDTPDLYQPDGLDEQYFGDTNTQTIDKLRDGLADLEKQSKAGVPDNPDAYEADIPDELRKQFFVEGEGGKDPVFEVFKGVAHEAGMSDAVFAKFMPEFLSKVSEVMPQLEGEDEVFANSNMDENFESYGGTEKVRPIQDEARARIDGLFNQKKIDQGVADELRLMTRFGTGLAVVEAFVDMSGEKSIPRDMGGSASSDLTREDLDSMAKDPKYWRDKDPAFVKKVTEGFEKLYR